MRNNTGLKNLYKLVSESNLDYFFRRPRMPRSRINALREGLIIGSACEAGELYRAIADGKPYEELLKIADFYDFLEIQPLGNNMFMVRNGLVSDVGVLQEHNKLICRLAKDLDVYKRQLQHCPRPLRRGHRHPRQRGLAARDPPENNQAAPPPHRR